MSELDQSHYSLDMNIMDKIIGILSRRIYLKKINFNSIGELKEILLKESRNINKETICNLIYPLHKDVLMLCLITASLFVINNHFVQFSIQFMQNIAIIMYLPHDFES